MHVFRVFRQPRSFAEIASVIVAVCALVVLIVRAAQTGDWWLLGAGVVIGLVWGVVDDVRHRRRRKRGEPFEP